MNPIKKGLDTMLEQIKKDLPYLENKYHRTDKPFDAFSRMAYHGWECPEDSGLDDAGMHDALAEYVDALPDTDHAVIKAKAFAFVLDNMRIGINEHDYFPLLWNWNRPLNFCTINRWLGDVKLSEENQKARDELYRSADITCWMDYDHSVPDWLSLYKYGFKGIKDRAARYRVLREESEPLTDKERGYFDSIDIEYAAILRLIKRLREAAEHSDSPKAPEMAKCFKTLENGAPVTTYERLMLIYLYFMLSESVDSYQVRSLGSGIDHDIDSVYREDLVSGRYTENELDDFIGYFLMQFSAIGNYWGQPMYIGGSEEDGSTRFSDTTLKILDIYDELGIYNPKIHVKYTSRTPEKYLRKICGMIRRGHSSFVFVCEDNVLRGMRERGIPFSRAYDFDVKGCYEFTVRGEEFSTAPMYINLAAPALYALNNAAPDASYKDIENAYFTRLREVFKKSIAICDDLETRIGEVNPSPMLSATIKHSLDTARDAYHDGADLVTTSILSGGLGTAVDSLAAIKYLVFDKKLTTIDNLREVLNSNWSDEKLRAEALSRPPKFGTGEQFTDNLAARICEEIRHFQGTKNSRGGYYKMHMHSARMYIEFGKRMPASPDGRKKGEETSKNASPVMGMDKNGVTALIRSALATSPEKFWEGYGLDIMLHDSAVKGEDGMNAMLALLKTYNQGGGLTIQFNVLNADALKDAQIHPEKYQTLQIRVCGWNTLWNNMPKSEQDKYIERAINI